MENRIQIKRCFSNDSPVRWLLIIFFVCYARPCGAAEDTSSLIEAAGSVELSSSTNPDWMTVRAGAPLHLGDRLRTGPRSRAAVQLTDRSVIRVDERSTLELLPPLNARKSRFRLSVGSLFFFDREKPADIEFETPIASGAIRGTEFLLQVSDELRVVMLDGVVSVGGEEITANQELRIRPGELPRKTALINAVSSIQWALYYPAVLNPSVLQWTDAARAGFATSISNYLAGDLLSALAKLPPGNDMPAFRAGVLLAVGRVDEAKQFASGNAALNELIATVTGDTGIEKAPQNSSEWLARSYTLQSRAKLPEALTAAREAVRLDPNFGFAHARVAELLFSFEQNREALRELRMSLELSPRLPSAHALQGFILLAQDHAPEALAAFDRAREIDAALGMAWLGRGIALMRQRNFSEAYAAIQAAAALEPQRGLFRSYLGKANSALHQNSAAQKEFALAKRFDSNDPTAWLYSALHLWENNRLNEAIDDLEKSIDLNNEHAPFRSRLLLDRDRSTRSADLAAIYGDAGLSEVSRHLAARSVAENYANFSGHLFLANSLQREEDPSRFNLRFETARQSELLVANLLAPPGAGNLSQQLSQQENLHYFDTRPIGFSSLTEYSSSGDWRQLATVFGHVDGLTYALDASYERLNGLRLNEEATRHQYFLTLKQRITTDDEFYFQAGEFRSRGEDLAALYDPANSKAGFTVHESQDPILYAGWHHTWSPGSHTLLLLGRLDDDLSFHDPNPDVLFIRQNSGNLLGIERAPFFASDFGSQFTLYSAELQQIFETDRQSLVFGARYQHGDVDAQSTLSQTASGIITADNFSNHLDREDVYSYYSLKLFEPLRIVAGLTYSHLNVPENSDFPPLSDRQSSADQLAPKAALFYTPWHRGQFRAAYSQSLGGLYFDNSVRLEPTELGGFNQAFRSLIPESVEGLLPGTKFETISLAFDQSLPTRTYLGVESEWLRSHGDRTIGILTNATLLPAPDTRSSLSQRLRFEEQNVSLYAAQLFGDYYSVGVRYRVSAAKLNTAFPELPSALPGLSDVEQDNRSILHQLSLAANFHHPSGIFSQWESALFQQSNRGYTPDRAGDTFWQHNLVLGYRFPRRHAELRIGFLNLADTDYRLNPLNLYGELPRHRTFTTSLRVNF